MEITICRVFEGDGVIYRIVAVGHPEGKFGPKGPGKEGRDDSRPPPGR